MKLTLICGEKGSGKTNYCLSEIEKIKNNNNGAKAVIIVPDQYSYVFEKSVTEKFGGTGLNGIEVLTMSQMSNRFLNKNRKNYLEPSGKAMLVQNAVFKAAKNDNVYSGCTDKPGFANQLTDTITQLKRNMITPEILIKTAETTKNKLLFQKLTSIARIYKIYEEENGGRFYDSDEEFISLSEAILNDGIFKDTYVFADEFSDFIPQHYKVLESILKNCINLSVTLPARTDSTDEILNIPKETITRLTNIARKNNCPYECINLDKPENPFQSEEINAFYKNYSNIVYKKYVPISETTKDIELFSAKNPYSEIEYIAKKIKHMCNNDGLRYRDFAISCGDTNKYLHIIDAVFNDYNIPYFSDNKLSVIDHPIVMTVLGVFEIFNSNWSFDAVFRYLKCGHVFVKNESGVSPLQRDEIDFLETYVQKRGIRGKKKWLSEEDWIYNDTSIGQSVENVKNKEVNDKYTKRINNIRRLIVKPIESLDKSLAGRNTAEHFARCLVRFLEDIHLYDGIIYETDILDYEGRRNEAEQNNQVWDILLNVINQSVVTLGDVKCSRKEYKEFIRAGLTSGEIAIIPSSLDSVTIGSAENMRQKDMSVLFVAGAVRGDIPKENTAGSFFSDSEKNEMNEILKNDELEFGQDLKKYKIQAEYKLFRVLFTAQKKLYVSYPVSDFEGESQVPSELIFNLRKLFPYIQYHDDVIELSEKKQLCFSPEEAFEYFMQNRNNKRDKAIPQIYDWMKNNNNWYERINKIDLAEKYKIESLKITPENAEKIYKNYSSYSVSRLNEYSKCPFAYFLKYGLKAKQPEVWQIQKLDLGSVMHYIICRYCEIVADDASDFEQLKGNWNAITKEKSEEIIDNVVKEIQPKIMSVLERDEAKVIYLLKRMSKTVKRSAETVRKSLINGHYAAAELEKHFEIKLDSDYDIAINGTIDRIDISKSENGEKCGIRIIDYKSGKKDFSVVSICNMQDIQLIVYAISAMELYKDRKIKFIEHSKEAEITGIMYNNLRDDMTQTDSGIDAEVPEIMKLNGPIILDGEDDNIMIDNALSMDKDLEEKQSSEFLNFKINKNGTISANTKYFTKSQFEKITRYVKDNIKKTDGEIRNGNIEIMPYINGQNLSCEFCDMAEICLFDRNINKTRSVCTKENEAWDIINKETEK